MSFTPEQEAFLAAFAEQELKARAAAVLRDAEAAARQAKLAARAELVAAQEDTLRAFDVTNELTP